MATTKKTTTKKTTKKKAAPKKAAPKLYHLSVVVNGAKRLLSFDSIVGRDAAKARLLPCVGIFSKGLQHELMTADGPFRYTVLDSVTDA